jgi:hypothetical protein
MFVTDLRGDVVEFVHLAIASLSLKARVGNWRCGAAFVSATPTALPII